MKSKITNKTTSNNILRIEKLNVTFILKKIFFYYTFLFYCVSLFWLYYIEVIFVKLNDLSVFQKKFMFICIITILVGLNTIYKTNNYFNNIDVETEDVKATVQDKYIEENKESYGKSSLSKNQYEYTYNVVLRYGDDVSIVQNKGLYDLYTMDEEVDAQLILHRNKRTKEIENKYVVPKTEKNTEIKIMTE